MELKELDFFKKQILSNANKALEGKVSLTNFLDENKQAIINSLKLDYVDIIFDGGFLDSEAKRVIFRPLYSDYNDFNIVIFEIKYNKRYLSLTHRMVLGNILSLGIKRESVGDIVFVDERVYFAVTKEISEYILNSFRLINGNPIELIKVDYKVKHEKSFVYKNYVVSSMRLDVIVAEAYNLSRSVSLEMIKEGLVSLNHMTCLNNSYKVKENDLISVRHKGRIYVKEIGGKTRSERINIKLGFLV